MSESLKTTNFTPPIRSIAGEASSLVQSNDMNSIKIRRNSKSFEDKPRERSLSSSSSTSTLSSSSSRTRYSVNEDPYDDISSNDENNLDLARLESRLQTLRRLSKLNTQK
jgi:hypothetical protein